jgi:hypothetical protein
MKITLAKTHENLFIVAKNEFAKIAEIETLLRFAGIETLPTCNYPYVTSELGA